MLQTKTTKAVTNSLSRKVTVTVTALEITHYFPILSVSKESVTLPWHPW